ncbi:unnamed protein product [Oppiella nova]|uniref:Uncharacterized protein n=1 Tax=Oppiella nova TaxID=334625 RepID=A0A7R9LRM4_9ACAR|nr:unnamed protein product [Oppiella nova]CAG2166301.1 unnamed protein product [Oppiella nova]
MTGDKEPLYWDSRIPMRATIKYRHLAALELACTPGIKSCHIVKIRHMNIRLIITINTCPSMASPSEHVPQESGGIKGDANEFKFDWNATDEDLTKAYNNVGAILEVLLAAKLNDNFFNILYRLKPIKHIDEYMLKFNYDKEVAIRHNEDLNLIIDFWLVLWSLDFQLSVCREILHWFKLLKQFDNRFVLLLKVLHQACRSTAAITPTPKAKDNADDAHEDEEAVKTSDPNKKSTETVPEVKAEVKLTIDCEGNKNDYSATEAKALIASKKGLCLKHYMATRYLHHCVKTLQALNNSNKTKIQRWIISENAIRLRSSIWTGRGRQDDKQTTKSPKSPDNKLKAIFTDLTKPITKPIQELLPKPKPADSATKPKSPTSTPKPKPPEPKPKTKPSEPSPKSKPSEPTPKPKSPKPSESKPKPPETSLKPESKP